MQRTKELYGEPEVYSYREASKLTGVSIGAISTSIHEDRPVNGFHFNRWARRDPESGEVNGLEIPEDVVALCEHDQDESVNGRSEAGERAPERPSERPKNQAMNAVSEGGGGQLNFLVQQVLQEKQSRMEDLRRENARLRDEKREIQGTVRSLREELDRVKNTRENPSRVREIREQKKDLERQVGKLEDQIQQMELEHKIEEIENANGLGAAVKEMLGGPLQELLKNHGSQLLQALAQQQQNPAQGMKQLSGSQANQPGQGQKERQAILRDLVEGIVSKAEQGVSGQSAIDWFDGRVEELEDQGLVPTEQEWITVAMSSLVEAKSRLVPVENAAQVLRPVLDRFGLWKVLENNEAEEVQNLLLSLSEPVGEPVEEYMLSIINHLQSDEQTE